MSQTAALLQCFAFQMTDCCDCFLLRSCNPDLKQHTVCLVSHLHGRQFIFLIGKHVVLLPLSRDLPVRGRYEVNGFHLDPLVSPGGKLTFYTRMYNGIYF